MRPGIADKSAPASRATIAGHPRHRSRRVAGACAIARRRPGGYPSPMVRFAFRLLATVSLAVAVILSILDATRSVAVSRLVLTPLGENWKAASPGTLENARAAAEISWPFLWDTVVVWLLAAPGPLVFALLALVLYAIGHRPQRRGDFTAE